MRLSVINKQSAQMCFFMCIGKKSNYASNLSTIMCDDIFCINVMRLVC